jgi:hypothetical protein
MTTTAPSKVRFFHILFSMATLFQKAECLTNQGPRFGVSASDQAMYGSYSTGEASLFGGSSTMYGAPARPLWKGKQKSGGNDNVMSAASGDRPDVPFWGDRVESMTFVPSMKNTSNKNPFCPRSF